MLIAQSPFSAIIPDIVPKSQYGIIIMFIYYLFNLI